MSGADLAIRLTAFHGLGVLCGRLGKWPIAEPGAGQAPSACGRLALESSWPTSSAPFTLSTDGATATLAATARQTAKVTGTNTGVGLYLNYAFTLVWLGTASGGTWLSAVMRRGPSGLEVSPMGSWRSCGLMPLWCSVRRLANRLAGQP